MSKTISRRRIFKWTAGCLAGVSVAAIQGCKGSSGSFFSFMSGDESDLFDAIQTKRYGAKWLTGGTASLQPSSYPKPFLELAANRLCALTPKLTEGPCYSTSPVRQDISGGQDGVPVRLYFQVVDIDCQPLSNVDVDIWHCDANGIYSGDGMRSERFCSGGNKEYVKHKWFRGIQPTNEQGTAYFETCFPGWYPGRAVHIHMTVTKNGRSYTTQVSFDDALVKSITTQAPLYLERGTPDTSNDSDRIFPDSDDKTYEMETMQLEDGSIVAWKTLVVSV
ncbi:intradiol ring-cleavage dioxygenase [Marinomonas balearica]|uniref:Dioxygenase-like protein n=1 Tax=Marinomonas balearica TaxID=491947 RepID=A0A4R6MDP3_9GAMM|nr:intradiol ring-cleavage dioxygenase [Marinomonas balearica]TDO98850.1 dioxygenase-like protein [Marinomonas balearica]